MILNRLGGTTIIFSCLNTCREVEVIFVRFKEIKDLTMIILWAYFYLGSPYLIVFATREP